MSDFWKVLRLHRILNKLRKERFRTSAAGTMANHACSICNETRVEAVADVVEVAKAINMLPDADSVTVGDKEAIDAETAYKEAKAAVDREAAAQRTLAEKAAAEKAAAEFAANGYGYIDPTLPRVKIKKLLSKKTYYVRARTYVKRNGVKYVSYWSAVKKVRIR